jgi:hypothetical protein
MAPSTTFNGSRAEARELIAAIAHQCSGGAPTEDGQQCTFDSTGVRNVSCAAHIALMDDQRFLNGILWMRHIAQRLRVEEFGEASPDERLLPTAVSPARSVTAGVAEPLGVFD